MPVLYGPVELGMLRSVDIEGKEKAIWPWIDRHTDTDTLRQTDFMRKKETRQEVHLPWRSIERRHS